MVREDFCAEANDQLLAFTPNPVVALHRAVAVTEVEGPATTLTLVDDPKISRDLSGYHLFHTIRGDGGDRHVGRLGCRWPFH